MSRDLSTAIQEAITKDVVHPFFAVELVFDDPNTLRLWTGFGTLVYKGLEWYGTGNMLGVSSIDETVEMAATGASVTLSGVPSEIISLALQEPYQGRVCNIYFGIFDKSSLQQEDEAYILLQDGSKIDLNIMGTNLTEIFSGYMDQMNIEETPDTSTIQLSIENKLIDLERPRTARFTSAYQKSLYPSDLGFDFVEDLQDKQIQWGRESK